jgi:hypothetical protein
MQKLIVVVLVLVVAAAGLAYWQGWFEVKKGDDNKTHLTINKEKFNTDKTAFMKKAGEEYKAGKEKIGKLVEKAKTHTGEDKDKIVKEVEELEKKHNELEKQIKDAEAAGEDKFESAKEDLKKQLADVDKQIDDLEKKLAKK